MRWGTGSGGFICCAVGVYYLIEGVICRRLRLGILWDPWFFIYPGSSMVACGFNLASGPGPHGPGGAFRRTFPQVLILFAFCFCMRGDPWMGCLSPRPFFLFSTGLLMADGPGAKGIAISAVFQPRGSFSCSFGF